MKKCQNHGALWKTCVMVMGLVLVSLPASADSDRDREYVVPGSLAWESAAQNGFTFRIQYGMCVDGGNDSKCVPDDGFSRPPYDGYETSLGLARIRAGTMIVERLGTNIRNPRSYVFEMFGERELGNGWEIKDVEILGTFMIEEMDFRTDGPDDDPVFKIRIYESPDEQRSALIKTVTLIGPPGADWRDAFRTSD